VDLELGSVDSSTLKERVYRRLLDAIVSGKIPPGTPITITQLAEKLGVSLMPVREALRKLEAEKFLSVQKNRRMMVKELSTSDLVDLLEIRLNLESLAAKRAVRNVTPELVSDLEGLLNELRTANSPEAWFEKNWQFHHRLYRDANSPILKETIENLWGRLSPYLHLYVSEIPNYTFSNRCHQGILEGVKENDPGKVSRWLRSDLKSAAELVVRFLAAHGGREEKNSESLAMT